MSKIKSHIQNNESKLIEFYDELYSFIHSFGSLEEKVEREYKSIFNANINQENNLNWIGSSILSITKKLDDLERQKEYLNTVKDSILNQAVKVFEMSEIVKLEISKEFILSLEKESKSSKTSIVIKNEKALIDAGFGKVILDTESVLKAYKEGLYHELILQNASIDTKTMINSTKLKLSTMKNKNTGGK